MHALSLQIRTHLINIANHLYIAKGSDPIQHKKTTMQLTSSDYPPPARCASYAKRIATYSLLYSFIALRTTKETYESFKASKRPSDPRIMKSSSYVRFTVRISGSEMTPNLRAALSPNARDRAKPGPQLDRPGAQILFGPEYLSFPI